MVSPACLYSRPPHQVGGREVSRAICLVACH